MTAKTVWNFLARVGLAEKVNSPDTVSEPPTTIAPPAEEPPAPNDEEEAQIGDAARSELAQAMHAAGAVLVEELGDLLDSLSAAVADDALRHKTALDILARRGHPPAAVVAEFDRCIGVLEERNREFAAQLEAQIARKVGGKLETMESCATQMRAKEAQMSQLQQEISELARTRGSAAAAVDGERARLTRIGQRFGAAYEAVLTEVQGRRSKIAPYAEGL